MSFQSYSEVKQAAFLVLNGIDRIARSRIKNQFVMRFWNWFVVSHGKNVIITMTDDELKTAMKEGYDALKPIYEKVNVARQLREAEKINDPVIHTKLMQMPNFQKLLELVD
jgi:DNA-binding PucR family transcriptional regulator